MRYFWQWILILFLFYLTTAAKRLGLPNRPAYNNARGILQCSVPSDERHHVFIDLPLTRRSLVSHLALEIRSTGTITELGGEGTLLFAAARVCETRAIHKDLGAED